MASYIKGNPVANATSYELFEKSGSIYTSLKTGSEINFNLDELSLSAGQHTLVVKAKADGYEDSDYSNEVGYEVENPADESNWTVIASTKDAGLSLANMPASAGGVKTFTDLTTTIPANTRIYAIDAIQVDRNNGATVFAAAIENVQVFITNANTKAVIDHPVDSATVQIVEDLSGTKVARIILDKTYNVPVHIGLKGDRNEPSNTTGINYGSHPSGSIQSFEALEIGTVVTANSAFTALYTAYTI